MRRSPEVAEKWALRDLRREELTAADDAHTFTHTTPTANRASADRCIYAGHGRHRHASDTEHNANAGVQNVQGLYFMVSNRDRCKRERTQRERMPESHGAGNARQAAPAPLAKNRIENVARPAYAKGREERSCGKSAALAQPARGSTADKRHPPCTRSFFTFCVWIRLS